MFPNQQQQPRQTADLKELSWDAKAKARNRQSGKGTIVDGLLDARKYKLRKIQPTGLIDQYQSEVMRGLLDYPSYGMRHDNSAPKGLGYFGKIPTADNPPYNPSHMTEYSMGAEIGGTEREIPSIVPTLTQQEIDWISNSGELTDEIMRKAYEHALMRIENGLSPFAD